MEAISEEGSMNSTYLNLRCKEILKMLLNHNTYLSLQQIAEELNISQRSIYYDLCRINEWLTNNGISELRMVRGKGLLLDAESRHKIELCTEEKEIEETYIYSPMERVQIIICSIIYASEPVHVDLLADYCKVSRNTIFNDMRVVVKQLQDCDLTLEYKSKKGYVITGDEIKIRAVFLLNFLELKSFFSSGGLKFIEWEKVYYYESVLKQVEKELGVEYVLENREALSILLPMMENRDEKLCFTDLKKDEIVRRKEYKLVERYFPKLNEEEKIYLCLHLLGGRIANVSEEIFENTHNEMVYEITKALVTEFEKVACVLFDDKEELERQLFIHINSSLYRYQYGIRNFDSLNVDVVREYPDLFEITKRVSRYLEQQIGLPIPDNEVAYLALHFGAHLPVVREKDEGHRVLVVCANGISTGNMLKREITKMFPEAEIVGVVSSANVKESLEKYELIVSTVKIKSVVPVIVVHPILTAQDKEQLTRYFRKDYSNERIKVSEIAEIVKPYVSETDYEKVHQLIGEYIQLNKFKKENEERVFKKNLLDLIDEKRIETHNDKYSWTQAIRCAAEYLIDSESIESTYVDSIISQLRYYGMYMFITNRVILVHSRPEAGVKKLDCAIHFFRNSVEFSDKDKASVVIVLAAEDHESHLKVLRDIIAIFENDEFVDEFLQCNSSAEIICKFKCLLEEKQM